MKSYPTCMVVLLASLLMFQAALAVPPQSSSKAAAAPNAHAAKPEVCFTDLFSGPLPGKADYCLGMRAWHEGHYESGLDLLKLAAGWGNKSAQYTLGLIYYGGHHVAADTALALAWLKLADERHNDDQIGKVRRSAYQWATPAERHRADDLFGQMAGTYGDAVAAARAMRHLRNWERRNGAFDSGCVQLAGAQAAAARRLGLVGEPPRSLDWLRVPSHPISVKIGSIQEEMKEMRKVARYRTRFSNANAGVCVTIHTQQRVTQAIAEKYFAGWVGVVTVGPLQQVPAAASSTHH